jgi:uncharacterized protein (TIGR02246 family)
MADEDDRGAAAVVTTDNEIAIRSLLTRLHTACARCDGAAYAQCFAEHSDYITFNGLHLRGRTENAALHSALFQGVLKGTKLSAEVESIELLSSSIALVHTAGSGRKRSYQTYVLVKAGTDWLIRSFQNTPRATTQRLDHPLGTATSQSLMVVRLPGQKTGAEGSELRGRDVCGCHIAARTGSDLERHAFIISDQRLEYACSAQSRPLQQPYRADYARHVI